MTREPLCGNSELKSVTSRNQAEFSFLDRDNPQNTGLTSAKFTNGGAMTFVFEFVNKTYKLIKLSETFIFLFQSSHVVSYAVFISFKFPLLL